MEWQGWLTLFLTASALGTLALTRIPAHMVMVTVLTVLSISGVLSTGEALSGFSNEGLITIAAMFVVAAGMQGAGAVDLLVIRLMGRPTSVRSALSRIFAPVLVLSAFLNNTPVVATMIPAVHAWSRRIGIPASKLMIPLSYTAILGGTITLIGTSTNLIVNGQYQLLTGAAGFSLFSISAVGLPVALAGLTYMWLMFPRWLPDTGSQNAFTHLREFTLEVAVDPAGPLVGKTVSQAGLRHLQRIYLIEIGRGESIVTAVPSEERLQGGDRLVFAGDTEAISDLLRINGIVPSESDRAETLNEPRAERRLVEAVVSPHCGAVGKAIRDARFRDQYGAAVLAVARHGERVGGNLGTIILEAGDTLLLEARPSFVARQRFNRDFLLVNQLDDTPPRHDLAYLAWAILFGVVIAAAFGVTSMLNAALVGAGLMVICGCCSASMAEKSIDLKVLLTIAASFSLGVALQQSGAAAYLANHIIQLSNGTPWLLLLLTYLAISLLTEVITNSAAALVMLPIVLDMTEQQGLNDEPFVFAIMMAASASFATPLGYQTNLMVYGPGNYRFTDFIKVGVPMNLFIAIASLSVLLLGWPLTRP